MLGGMMPFPLTLTHLLDRAGRLFGAQEIVTRMPDRSVARIDYAAFHRRSRGLAAALVRAGLEPGDRVATLCWNHAWHLEAYFGIPVAGGVLHTLNLRLHPSDIGFIAKHAADRFLIVDDVLYPLYEQFAAEHRFERVIVVPLTGKPVPAGTTSYEEFIADDAAGFTVPEIDENAAAGMCYTSGTTGKPKGVVYSHRATVLHTLAAALPDALAMGNADSILPVVPMFHANAWGTPYAAVMVGAKLVFPGPHLDPESLLDLFVHERVTFSAGVPTVWMGIVEAYQKDPQRWAGVLPGLRMAVGGSAPPPAMIRAFDSFGWKLIHAWGMTELTPLGSVAYVKQTLAGASEEDLYSIRSKQGLPVPFVETRAMTAGGEAPWDGTTMGELQVRGPWVAARYHEGAVATGESTADRWSDDGWFRTGDIVTIDAEGYIKITDRTKDVIKSGGEWISSVDLENALMGHPGVKEAAVIAVPHPKWQERPLAAVVPREGESLSAQQLRDYLGERFAKWWVPDAIVFIDAIPRTSTGKFLKSALRERFETWTWD